VLASPHRHPLVRAWAWNLGHRASGDVYTDGAIRCAVCRGRC